MGDDMATGAGIERSLRDAAAPGRVTLFLRACVLGTFGTLFVIQKKVRARAARTARFGATRRAGCRWPQASARPRRAPAVRPGGVLRSNAPQAARA